MENTFFHSFWQIFVSKKSPVQSLTIGSQTRILSNTLTTQILKISITMSCALAHTNHWKSITIHHHFWLTHLIPKDYPRPTATTCHDIALVPGPSPTLRLRDTGKRGESSGAQGTHRWHVGKAWDFFWGHWLWDTPIWLWRSLHTYRTQPKPELKNFSKTQNNKQESEDPNFLPLDFFHINQHPPREINQPLATTSPRCFTYRCHGRGGTSRRTSENSAASCRAAIHQLPPPEILALNVLAVFFSGNQRGTGGPGIM